MNWWVESFPYAETSLVDCEAIFHTRWTPKDLKREPALMTQKWFDYRPLHPVLATYLFSHIFSVECRRIIRAHIDDAPPRVMQGGRVLDWNPIKEGDVFEPPAAAARLAYWKRKIGGLVRARQAADADGIPYPVFIKAALHHFYFGGGTYVMARAETRSKMPEPTLFYSDEVLFAVRTAWLEQIKMKVQSGEHPRYRLENDDGHPDHAQHREWLTQQLGLRSVQEFAAARLVKANLLSADDALLAMRKPADLRRMLSA